MKLILYEWKKLFKKKTFVIGILFMLTLDMFNIAIPYVNDQQANRLLNDTYDSYSERLTGYINNDLFLNIEELKISINNGETKSVSGSKDGDILVLSDIEKEILRLREFKDKNKLLVEKIDDNIAYFRSVNNKEQSDKFIRYSNTYENRQLSYFANHKGWDKLIDNQISIVLILVLMFLVIPNIWNEEMDEDMLVIINTTKNGKKSILKAKLLFMITFVLAIVIIFTLFELIIYGTLYGLDGYNLPIYVNETYKLAVMNITMVGFVFYNTFFKIITFICLGLLMKIISRKISNTIISTMSCVLVVFVFFIIAETDFLQWNFVSPLYFYETINNQSLISIFGIPLYLYETGCLATFMMFVSMLIYYFIGDRRL